MSRLSRDRDSLVDHMRVMLLAGYKPGVTAPNAATSAAWTVTYTTDDPANVPNRAITVADGDSLTDANQYEFIDEIEGALNKASADARAVLAAVAAIIAGDNVFDFSLADMTMGADATAGTAHIGFTYTTDAPSFTLNGTTTIADGDLTTAPEFHEFAREASRTLALLRKDIGNVHTRVKQIIGQRSFAGITVVPALSAGTFTVTYTTDEGSTTVNQATTISDGDGAISVAQKNDVIHEVKDQLNKTLADITAARTALNSWLAFADIA